MKARLLKTLRGKFIVEYFPSTKRYKVSGSKTSYHSKEKDAIAQKEYDMIKYAREHYQLYSKRIRI